MYSASLDLIRSNLQNQMSCRCVNSVLDTFTSGLGREQSDPKDENWKKNKPVILLASKKGESWEKSQRQGGSRSNDSPQKINGTTGQTKQKIMRGDSSMECFGAFVQEIKGESGSVGNEEQSNKSESVGSFQKIEVEMLPGSEEREFTLIPNSSGLAFPAGFQANQSNSSKNQRSNQGDSIKDKKILAWNQSNPLKEEPTKQPNNTQKVGYSSTKTPGRDEGLVSQQLFSAIETSKVRINLDSFSIPQESEEEFPRTPAFKEDFSLLSVSFGFNHPSQSFFESGEARSELNAGHASHSKSKMFGVKLETVENAKYKKNVIDDSDLDSPLL